MEKRTLDKIINLIRLREQVAPPTNNVGSGNIAGTAASGQPQATTTSAFYKPGEGWVGITTYTQDDGTLRVKKEILVAMSGIATAGVGTGIPYPTNQA